MGRSRKKGEIPTTAAGVAALAAIQQNQLTQLGKVLLDFPDPRPDVRLPANRTETNKILVSDMDKIICAAALNSRPELFDWLINDRFPDWIPYYHSGSNFVWEILRGGPAVIDLFYEKWPDLIDEDIGIGNALAHSMMQDNKTVVESLLKHGAKPNDAQFGWRYLIDPIDGKFSFWTERVPDDIIQLCLDYGLEVPDGATRKHVGRNSCVVL